jgi:long-chain acyl-CoA synthetase
MLTRMLRKAVQAHPAKAAIVQGDRRIRYDELFDLAGRCAHGLRRLGVGAGDCVAVILPNCPEFVTMLFACARLRAVMLPLNPQYTREEVQRLAADAGAKAVIADPPRGELFAGAGATIADFGKILADSADPMPDEFGGPALYLYTSGSTDAYKRVCCTGENLFYEAHNFVETVRLTAEDNILCTIPLYHSYGTGNCLLDAVYAGSTLVLLDADDAPFAGRCGRVLELIRQETIRFYPGVPYQFAILAAFPEAVRADLSGLKLCVSSGDVLPRQTYQRFFDRFGQPIRSLYGSTEAGSISLDTDPVETLQFGSLGRPLKNVEIRIRDEAGHDLPTGESGLIWVKSPVIPPAGYDNRPELSAQVFRNGYYNTGDIGKQDARGYLVMTGRKQTFVDVGGYKVDIGEVEEVLQNHPQVREAAALGVEISGLGTVIKAAVVTEGSCREADLLSYCRERLALFKVPRLIEIRDTLPRSPIGKVLKAELGDVTAFLDSVRPADFQRDWRAVAKKGREQQIELLAAHVTTQAAASLQCEPASVVPSMPFQSMGFDSLRVAELQQRLVKLTSLQLPVTVLWNYPSVQQLAEALWEQINAGLGDGARTATPAVDHSPAGDLESLSREEIAALLAQELSALEEGKNQ